MEPRILKKGEKLFEEKDTLDKVYLVKSGRLTVFIERNGKRIEIGLLTTGHVVGDKALYVNGRAGFCVMATQESSVLEVPVTMLKPHLEGGHPVMKMLLKGLSDRIQEMQKTLMSGKMEGDILPCSERQVTRVFSVIAFYAAQSGIKDEKTGMVTVSWNAMKMFATRMFLESPVRLQQAVELLTKLKYTEMVYKRDEIEDEDVLSDIKISNVEFIREFADFYQYNYYKGGAGEILKVDETVMKIVKAVNEIAKEVEADRRGAAEMSYDKFAAEMKSKYKMELKPMHFDMLEKKGLFLTRKARDEGVLLQFDKKEFLKVFTYWQILQEIDKWNAQGFINMKEEQEKAAAEAPTACPECGVEVQAAHKFCAGCGFKLAA